MSTPVPPTGSSITTVTTPTDSSTSGTRLKTPSAPTPSSVLTVPTPTVKPVPATLGTTENTEPKVPVKPKKTRAIDPADNNPFNAWLKMLLEMLFSRGGGIFGTLGALLWGPGKLIEKITGNSALLSIARNLEGYGNNREFSKQEQQYRVDQEAYKKAEDSKVAKDAQKETDQAMQLETAEQKLAEQQKNAVPGSPSLLPDYTSTIAEAGIPSLSPAPVVSPTPSRPNNP